MKKTALVLLTMALSANLMACGGAKAETSTTAAPATTAAATEAPATKAETEAEADADQADAEEELTYTLDYDDIASWVEAGFIGTDAAGSPVVMAIDAANENAVIIFGDNDDMTAVSFLGEITYDGDMATITDVANDFSLTFSVVQTAEDTLELDMGEIGSATIKAASLQEVLDTLKLAIENYTHVM